MACIPGDESFSGKGAAAAGCGFAANDDTAFGCIKALREAEYSVPEDISVLGCDDVELSQWYAPALTTIRTHIKEQGALAIRELVGLTRGYKEGEIHRIAGEIIERSSCRRK